MVTSPCLHGWITKFSFFLKGIFVKSFGRQLTIRCYHPCLCIVTMGVNKARNNQVITVARDWKILIITYDFLRQPSNIDGCPATTNPTSQSLDFFQLAASVTFE